MIYALAALAGVLAGAGVTAALTWSFVRELLMHQQSLLDRIQATDLPQYEAIRTSREPKSSPTRVKVIASPDGMTKIRVKPDEDGVEA